MPQLGMAEIIPFPQKKVEPHYDFSNVVQCALTVTAVNLYGHMYDNPIAGPNDLHTLDPIYIKNCVDKARRSNVFSTAAQFQFFQISLMMEGVLKKVNAKSFSFK